MTVSLDEMMKGLGRERRAKVEARAAELIAEQMTLRDLRHALELTQERVAKNLGINQENLSRLERRSDLLLSTLSRYVEAMGGALHLVAKFPDRPPVFLTGLAALNQDKPKKGRRPSRSKQETNI